MSTQLPPIGPYFNELPYAVQDWLRLLRTTVIGGGGVGILFNSLDFTGSNLTSLLTRNHDSLQNISGGSAGQYNHLTTADYAAASNLRTLTSKSVAGAVDVTLSASEAQCRILKLTGAITGNINVIVPTAVWQWTVNNATTGAFTLTVKTVAGTGIVVGSSKNAILYCDGTNVVRATADV